MRNPDLNVMDYETWPIESRPKYPPKPCGVALWLPGCKPMYAAWDHASNNGLYELRGKKVVKLACSDPEAWARKRLKDVWRGKLPVLFHNGKFDNDVAETHHGLALLPPERYRDSMFSLFLKDPHAPNLQLKPSSERILGLPPEERDAAVEWLLEHQPVPGITLSASPQGKYPAAAYIRYLPGDIAALYACGDVVRTWGLHDKQYPELDAEEREAYLRECRLQPILIQNEREGLRVDLPKLLKDIKLFRSEQERVSQWLRKRLKSPDLNLQSPQQLARALIDAKVIDADDFGKTESSTDDNPMYATNKKEMTADLFQDLRVFRGLAYISRLKTALGTFMEPWAAVAKENNSYIYTQWFPVRGSAGGARSGRVQSRPNFQNIPKVWDDKGDGYEHPRHLSVRELPLIRQYIVPDKGEWFGHRDYNQQELRILAHYENDKLLEAFNADHKLDVHQFITDQIKIIAGLDLQRRQVKVVNFRTVYGGGAGGLAEALDIELAKAKQITRALRAAIPGLKHLEDDLKSRAKDKLPLRTFGGRLYYCEPPSYSKKFKKFMSYEYKMLNYLIQPSAADTTKEAIIRYHEVRKHGRFLLSVHDEINISAPGKAMKGELLRLRDAMESLGTGGSARWGVKLRFDLPMYSDAKMGPTNWAGIKKFNEAERKVA